jgi:hypothetical protein
MNICIEKTRRWFVRHPKTSQWAWFCLLWFGGLTAALVLSMPFKLLIRAMR